MIIGPWDTKKMVIVDFESFFDDTFTLRKMRMEEYILDKRFKVHGVAVAYPNGKTEWVEGDDVRRWLKSHKKFGFVGHNYFFDGLIWKLQYNHVAPSCADTKLLSNAVFGPAEVSGGNDLESVAERLGFQPKGKIDIFKGKYDLSSDEMKAMAAYATNDADLEYKVFHALLPRLTRPEFEAWLIQHTLNIYINKPLPVSAEKCRAAMRKVEANVHEKCKALPKIVFDCEEQKGSGKNKRIETTKKTVDEEVLASNKQFGQALIQTLQKHKVKVPMKMGKNSLIPALAKADEGFMALKSCGNKMVQAMVIARLCKRSGDTQIARLRTLLKVSALGGFRVYLNYWGACTGRWTGGSGLNAHNFPNPGRSSDEFEREVATLIRECISPPKGRKFSATDAANIEARVLAWWAGQQDLVDAFGSGEDVYSSFATETFHEEVRKPKADDPKPKAVRFKLLRGAGKGAVLGLGYSMAAPKFERQQRGNPEVRALFETGELTTTKCEEIVKLYRKKYPMIPALWRKVEGAFFSAREGAERCVNGVLFTKGRDRGVDVTLPSGRVIHYPNVRIGTHGDANAPKKCRVQWVYGHGKGKKIYGGLLVENIVQAISRDILAEAVWSMEQEGYEVNYHVHDSVVAVPPAAKAKKCLDYCVEVLSQSPEWATGMKLGAEGTIEEGFA